MEKRTEIYKVHGDMCQDVCGEVSTYIMASTVRVVAMSTAMSMFSDGGGNFNGEDDGHSWRSLW